MLLLEDGRLGLIDYGQAKRLGVDQRLARGLLLLDCALVMQLYSGPVCLFCPVSVECLPARRPPRLGGEMGGCVCVAAGAGEAGGGAGGRGPGENHPEARAPPSRRHPGHPAFPTRPTPSQPSGQPARPILAISRFRALGYRTKHGNDDICHTSAVIAFDRDDREVCGGLNIQAYFERASVEDPVEVWPEGLLASSPNSHLFRCVFRRHRSALRPTKCSVELPWTVRDRWMCCGLMGARARLSYVCF